MLSANSHSEVLVILPPDAASRQFASELTKCCSDLQVHVCESVDEALSAVDAAPHRTTPKLALVGLPKLDALVRGLRDYGLGLCVPIVTLRDGEDWTSVHAAYATGARSVLDLPKTEAEAQELAKMVCAYWIRFNLVPDRFVTCV